MTKRATFNELRSAGLTPTATMHDGTPVFDGWRHAGLSADGQPVYAPLGDLCRSCGAAIRWAVTEKDRPIPLDAMPRPDGNIVLTAAEPGTQPTAHYIRATDVISPEAARYVAHFVTCPNADQHRKKAR